MDVSKNFSNIGFEDFRRLAADPALSKYEKIGFPDDYRAGHEGQIFADICSKLTNLQRPGIHALDIGPGCSDLPKLLIDLCTANKSKLTLVDSEEMLQLLPDGPEIEKVAALYPRCPELNERLASQVDAVVCYSVLQYALIDTALYRFLDTALNCLAPGGQLLLGDIPNVSKRKRFFASETGAAFHRAFMNTDEAPEVLFNRIEFDQIDDAIVMSILQRARAQGFDAYVLPQHPALPMANRREDILIVRP
jgi:cyclopropane fatty-acyl-phospholipid synthase-like methyltransferase